MCRDLNKQEVFDLEALIDRAGLCAVLQSLSTICNDKADHIRTNWQDNVTAKAWDSAAGVIGVAACNKHVAAIGEG